MCSKIPMFEEAYIHDYRERKEEWQTPSYHNVLTPHSFFRQISVHLFTCDRLSSQYAASVAISAKYELAVLSSH